MEFSELGLWKLSPNTQLFFNEIDKKFFVKENKSVYFFLEDSWVEIFAMGDFGSKKFLSCCLSIDGTLLAYQTIDTEMVTKT